MTWAWWQYRVKEQDGDLGLQHPAGEPTAGPKNLELTGLSLHSVLQCSQH